MANPNPSPATRFQPGNNASNGRPPGRRFIDELEEEIDERKARPALRAKFLSMMLAGDFRAWKEYLDRRDGKVPQPLSLDAPTGVIDCVEPAEERAKALDRDRSEGKDGGPLSA